MIALTYEEKLASDWAFRRFALIRAIRLYPLVIAATSAVLFLRCLYPHAVLPQPELVRDALLNAMLLPNLTHSSGDWFPIVAPSWSLFFELVVNLTYAASLPWLNKAVLRGIIIVSGILLLGYAFQEGTVRLLHQHFVSGLMRTVFSFSVGVWIYRNRPSVVTWGGKLHGSLAYLITIAVLVLPGAAAGGWLAEMFAIVVLFPFVTVVAIASSEQGKRSRLEFFLGELSYPVYLLHMPAAAYVGAALGWFLGGTALAAAAAIAAIVGSYAAWRFYDLPIRRWLGSIVRARMDSPVLRAEP